MDIVRWRFSLKAGSITDWPAPAATVTVQLKCPDCPAVVEAWSWVGISPSNLQDSSTVYIGKAHRSSEDRWNVWIARQLAKPRFCTECGRGSIIPTKQVKALVKATDAFNDWSWLVETTALMGYTTRRRMTHDARREADRRYETIYERLGDRKGLIDEVIHPDWSELILVTTM